MIISKVDREWKMSLYTSGKQQLGDSDNILQC